MAQISGNRLQFLDVVAVAKLHLSVNVRCPERFHHSRHLPLQPPFKGGRLFATIGAVHDFGLERRHVETRRAATTPDKNVSGNMQSTLASILRLNLSQSRYGPTAKLDQAEIADPEKSSCSVIKNKVVS